MKCLISILFMIIACTVHAQVITVTMANSNGLSNALANDYLIPLPNGALIWDNEIKALGNLVAGFSGYDYGKKILVHAQEGTPHQPPGVTSFIGNGAFIGGDNTSTLRIKWKNTGRNYAKTDAHYAEIHSTLMLNVNMQVTGIAPGTDVIVYWWYNVFGSGVTEHEDPLLLEDSIRVTNGMVIDGTNQFPNHAFSFRSPNGLPGWKEWKNVTGTLKATVGQDFTFAINSSIDLYLDNPGEPTPNWPVDQNDGIFKGEIVFTVAPLIPPIVNNTAEHMLPLFSVDIGSDSEFSDPFPDGTESFDPGDIYPAYNGPPIPFPVPLKDDSIIFSVDPDPAFFPALIPAPVQSGLLPSDVQRLFFDLDGSDCIQLDLNAAAFGPGSVSIPWTNDSCIFEAEYLFLSFDDDISDHYVAPFPSVPMNSHSPVLNRIYSELGKQNEISEYTYNFTPPSWSYFQGTTFSESSLHINLAPDPAVDNTLDDDIDALDMIGYAGNHTPCSVWYFSADHEATFVDPLDPVNTLSPNSIYQLTPGGPIPVITSLHHGLLDGTDIDGFEFAWVWDTAQSRSGLALIFSVDDDDPQTLENESGGLNPQMLYYSFLDGTSHIFSPNPLHDDIDGIAIWKHSLNGTAAFPNPVWRTKTWNGSNGNNWNNPFNWFPQGVPFFPEDVIIPAVSPYPVINTNGLDCKNIDVLNGGFLQLLPGIIFTLKG